jgi:hypothetical protein
VDVKEVLQALFHSNRFGAFSEEELSRLKNLENKNNIKLHNREAKWQLQSQVGWLDFGDENTNFFHHFAHHGKRVDTIWYLQDKEG